MRGTEKYSSSILNIRRSNQGCKVASLTVRLDRKTFRRASTPRHVGITLGFSYIAHLTVAATSRTSYSREMDVLSFARKIEREHAAARVDLSPTRHFPPDV